jgi:uncharacterized protein YhbP (UPF0306 family)
MERILEPAQLKSALENLLGLSTMTLATTSRDGEVHAADVYFACGEQLDLYFFSDAESQHSMDLRGEERAAVTIHADRDRWEEILGLQMRGICSAIPETGKWKSGWDVYLAKFPFVSDLADLIKVNQLYAFSPHWVRLVDNSRGFGFKREWRLTKVEAHEEEADRWEQVSRQGNQRQDQHG